MWVLLSRQVRTWLLFVLVLPLLARAAVGLAERLESRHGRRTRTSALLRRAGRLAGTRARPDRTGTLHKAAGVVRDHAGTGPLHHVATSVADTLEDVAAPARPTAPARRRGLLGRFRR